MNCPECGASVSNASYCTECGAELDGAPTASSGQDANSGATGQRVDQPSDRGATGQQPNQPKSTQRATQSTDSASTAQQATQSTADRTTDRAPPRDAQPTDSGWATSRMVAAGGGVLAGVSLFLPWVTAVAGDFSANGMATEFGTLVMAGAVAAVAGAVVNWGRGWGWLSMLFTGLSGLAVASAATLFQAIVSETDTISMVEINGNRIPIAAVEPATGVQVAIIAGALVALAALAGIVGSLTGD
jgi:hypothetical protein